jgi:hypothetical protein
MRKLKMTLAIAMLVLGTTAVTTSVDAQIDWRVERLSGGQKLHAIYQRGGVFRKDRRLWMRRRVDIKLRWLSAVSQVRSLPLAQTFLASIFT